MSSTGDGTIGKCSVYRSSKPAIADGHVTIVRPDEEQVNPEYLCDYLRVGFGHRQVDRLFTGSTGLVELPEGCVDSIVVKLTGDPKEQKEISDALRAEEDKYQASIKSAENDLLNARNKFEITMF